MSWVIAYVCDSGKGPELRVKEIGFDTPRLAIMAVREDEDKAGNIVSAVAVFSGTAALQEIWNK